MCVAVQAQRPEKHTRGTDGVVPSKEDVHAGANIGNLQWRLSPWQGKLKDVGGVKGIREFLVEETRLNDGK